MLSHDSFRCSSQHTCTQFTHGKHIFSICHIDVLSWISPWSNEVHEVHEVMKSMKSMNWLTGLPSSGTYPCPYGSLPVTVIQLQSWSWQLAWVCACVCGLRIWMRLGICKFGGMGTWWKVLQGPPSWGHPLQVLPEKASFSELLLRWWCRTSWSPAPSTTQLCPSGWLGQTLSSWLQTQTLLEQGWARLSPWLQTWTMDLLFLDSLSFSRSRPLPGLSSHLSITWSGNGPACLHLPTSN